MMEQPDVRFWCRIDLLGLDSSARAAKLYCVAHTVSPTFLALARMLMAIKSRCQNVGVDSIAVQEYCAVLYDLYITNEFTSR